MPLAVDKRSPRRSRPMYPLIDGVRQLCAGFGFIDKPQGRSADAPKTIRVWLQSKSLASAIV